MDLRLAIAYCLTDLHNREITNCSNDAHYEVNLSALNLLLLSVSAKELNFNLNSTKTEVVAKHQLLSKLFWPAVVTVVYHIEATNNCF